MEIIGRWVIPFSDRIQDFVHAGQTLPTESVSPALFTILSFEVSLFLGLVYIQSNFSYLVNAYLMFAAGHINGCVP